MSSIRDIYMSSIRDIYMSSIRDIYMSSIRDIYMSSIRDTHNITARVVALVVQARMYDSHHVVLTLSAERE